MMPTGWATWANLLTLSRLLILPASVLAILFSDWHIAAALFGLAIATDYLDGKLARALQQQSNLGGLFDHATDACYVAACCWALAQAQLLTLWLAPLILLAFGQYALDSKALAGQPLRASLLGRSNGIAYFVLVGTAIGAYWLAWPWLQAVVGWAAWLLVVSSLLSMADRGYALIKTRGA